MIQRVMRACARVVYSMIDRAYERVRHELRPTPDDGRAERMRQWGEDGRDIVIRRDGDKRE